PQRQVLGEVHLAHPPRTELLPKPVVTDFLGHARWHLAERRALSHAAPSSSGALAIENGATLCTTDRDFTRFPGARIVDPTAT
ncbi:MAG TPA: hypothetical protein VGF40_19475, partial [Thermoanaerobaculia bacterium]